MGFNKEQTQAIKASSNVDILISAGAGSGKTKTLSQRVSRLLEEGEKPIKPSELLVLTFTDNAAHEMKDRIIKDLKTLANKETDLKKKAEREQRVVEMYSAHVQTFDSFSSYLVKKYASKLGISDRITIASESVILTKENKLLDEIFDEHYKDDDKSKVLLETLKKFNLQGDAETKAVILDLYHQLGKLIAPKKKAIFEEYDKKYLSREFFDELISFYIKSIKEEIRKQVWKIYVESNFKEKLSDPVENEEYLKTYFSEKGNFDFKLSPGMEFYYYDKKKGKILDDGVSDFFPDFVSLLSLDGEEFIAGLQSFYKNHEGDFPIGKAKNKAMARIFKNHFFNPNSDECITKYLLRCCLPLEQEYQKFISFKNDIHLMLDIIKELEKRLFEYKKMCGYFTFQDISNMALSLLIDEKYQDIAKEIRSRFKYIMVDEYQDANDFQEIFINELLKKDENGERAHVFCVGDAKQSIYAFRNSNVALFRGRQNLYNDGNANEHYVIPMNKNYRSGPGLLKDINYIFNSYMTLAHGSIPYKDVSEQLEYDKQVNIYKEPYNHFGVYRLLSYNENKDDWNASYGNMRSYCREWEARAIAKDIKNKISDGFKVYDRDPEKGPIRPCQYSDFAILMRKKAGFELYQKIFNEEGIPLNNSVSTDLKEVNCILLIQSLMKMVGYMLGEAEDNPDPKHYFASIARSYIYQYDDETLYALLSYQSNDPKDLLNDKIRGDQIYKDILSFAIRNKNSSFDEIFLDMLESFHIIEKLYLLGNVQDNISKIESIRELVVSSEKAGEGLKEFINLLLNINKYSLSFSADSIIQVQGAVDMMTIHASKGLERKIVYLPYSFNSISNGGGGKKPDYFFDERFGIQLPNYFLGDNEEKKERIHFLPYDIALNTPSPNGNENDEHVRLFYVALTRAENMIYIVGDDYQSESKDNAKETLYGMLNCSTHYPVFNQEIALKRINPQLMEKYECLVKQIKRTKYYLSKEDLKDNYELYTYIFDEVYLRSIKDSLQASIDSINDYLFEFYHLSFTTEEADEEAHLDKTARLFDALNTHLGVKSFRELVDFFANNNPKEKDTFEIEEELTENDEYESEEGDENNIADNCYNEDQLKDILEKFYKAVKEEDPSFFGFSSKNDKDGDKKKMKKMLLPALVSTNEYSGPISRISYKSEGYDDKVEYISVPYWGEKEDSKEPPSILKHASSKIDDSEIKFEKKEHKRASKKLEDDELDIRQERLDRGIHLHRLLELLDFETMDLSYIKEQGDKNIIKRVIDSPLFKEAHDADEIYQEYAYYDEVFASNGSIDLLYRKGKHFTIVDYKTSHIDDPAYIEQLHVYQRNVQALFGLEPKDISLYLLSISKGEFKKVDVLE